MSIKDMDNSKGKKGVLSMQSLKIKPGAFKHIEAELSEYQGTVRRIQQRREELMMNISTDENTGGGKSNIPSRPTEQLATRLVDDLHLQELERIASSIEHVYNICDDERKKLVRLKYWTHPQTKTWDGIAQDLNISKRQAYRWRDEIVQAIGEKLGWR